MVHVAGSFCASPSAVAATPNAVSGLQIHRTRETAAARDFRQRVVARPESRTQAAEGADEVATRVASAAPIPWMAGAPARAAVPGPNPIDALASAVASQTSATTARELVLRPPANAVTAPRRTIRRAPISTTTLALRMSVRAESAPLAPPRPAPPLRYAKLREFAAPARVRARRPPLPTTPRAARTWNAWPEIACARAARARTGAATRPARAAVARRATCSRERARSKI